MMIVEEINRKDRAISDPVFCQLKPNKELFVFSVFSLNHLIVEGLGLFLPFLQDGFSEKDILLLGIHTKIFSSPVNNRFMSNSLWIFSPLWKDAYEYVTSYLIT